MHTPQTEDSLELKGWRKGAAMLLAGFVGVAVAYLAVSYQYGTPGSVDLEEGYATRFMVIGLILGLLIGNVFTRFQRNGFVWIAAAAAGIVGARYFPSFSTSANSMNRSTMAAWFGLLSFSALHFLFLTFRKFTPRKDRRE